MRRTTLATLILCVFTLSVATPSFGGNTDPSGSQLRAYVENYLKTAMPTDALAAKINSYGGANSAGVQEWLCSLEIANTLSVGYSVWEARMQADTYYTNNFAKSQFIPLNIANYCITYSNNCSHWEWSPNCLKNKLGN